MSLGIGKMGPAMLPIGPARRVLFAVALGFAATFSAPAPARWFQDGLAACERGDYDTALHLWPPLTEHGYADAQFDVGTMYDAGRGVPQDFVNLHMWFSFAAWRSSPGGQSQLAATVRDGVASLITPKRIAEAQRLAGECKPK